MMHCCRLIYAILWSIINLDHDFFWMPSFQGGEPSLIFPRTWLWLLLNPLAVRGVTAPINEVLEGLADLLEISPKLLEVGRFSKFVGNWMMEWFFVGFWIFISWILVYSWILDLKMQENALFLPKFQKFSQAGRSPEPSKFFTSSTRRNRACSTYLLLYGYHIQPFKSF